MYKLRLVDPDLSHLPGPPDEEPVVRAHAAVHHPDVVGDLGGGEHVKIRVIDVRMRVIDVKMMVRDIGIRMGEVKMNRVPARSCR